ncbi:Lipase esterase family protein [Aspergillus sclerotialis]|uniref:Lipase esterase family protein n=1 Tax=Aspergillus sclerotialis TaxID=2070753 RepID=A0A3A2ZT38_9EURO|nr:Lipase esterase family protein [Aspergillus sclerotialis]
MPMNPVALSAALAPTVVSTWFSHYLNRKSLQNEPSVHLSYDEGLHIIREFLVYASKYPVEDLQAFSRQRVPSPHWVKNETVTIPEKYLTAAASNVIDQLGPKGIERIGGKEWWQWRGRGPSPLKGEFIEMRKDHQERKHAKCNRVMLYIHGGAFSFGSIQTHRYQLQRHARKLKGLVFAREIIFAGDSAGGGLVLSMLVTIRDQGLPLPAGGILISPWVDLTHSFPSIVSDNPGDYLPPSGFRHKPSPAWPPPNADEIAAVEKEGGSDHKNAPEKVKRAVPQSNDQDAVYGYSVYHNGSGEHCPSETGASDQKAKQESITVNLDGKMVEIKDQIQMYATNQLLTHPLVSPVLQPSLGGLPPLFVLSGGAEMLRDEQFYLAHKAANPTAYAPSEAYLDEHDPNRELLNKYQPTYVQLQVWEGLCHVAPTLSFTRPAKFMYRAIAQFGAYALARAQNSEIDILDDEDVSPILSDVDAPRPTMPASYGRAGTYFESLSVGKAGDPLPAFHKHMIRQRVDNTGTIHPLDPPSTYEVLQIPSSAVGAINPQLVKRWIEGKREWDEKFAKEKRRMQQQRIKELSHGLRDFNGESPPPSSLAARRAAPGVLPEGKKNYPLFLWSLLASKHDKRTIGRETKAEGETRRRSVDAKKTGSTRDSRVLDPKEQDISNEDASSEKDTTAAEPGHDTSPEGRDFASEPAKPSMDKPMSPLLILPDDDDVKKSIEENASTRALFHAPGTLPMTSQVSLAPSARPASWTVRSRSDDVSTIGDKDSATVTSAGLGSPDNASTRAVMGAGGVVGLIPDTSNSQSNA